MMRYRKELLEIINYAYGQAENNICVCPSAVPEWDDRNLTDEMYEKQLCKIRLVRAYFEHYDTNRRNVHPNTVQWLMSFYMSYTFTVELLATISVETLNILSDDMICHFEDLSVTVDDIKAAWKEWFSRSTVDGTLICPHLRIVDKDVSWLHPELRVADSLLEITYKAIDEL